MKTKTTRRGAALILTLMLLALMLTLVLYYVSLVRLQTGVSGYSQAERLSRAALDRALAEALAELEHQHHLRAESGRAFLAPETWSGMRSQGGEGAVTGGVTEAELASLGWPDPAEVALRLAGAEWVLDQQTNGLQTVYAWVLIPLSGLLDPEGMKAGWETSLIDGEGELFFSPAEFRQRHPEAEALFMPGAYSRDQGWYDFDRKLWQTNVTVAASTLGMNPLVWRDGEVQALFQMLYPGRDSEAISRAFLDFREGKTLPTDPDGISAVPVPMFNEFSAEMSVENLGDRLKLTQTLDLEIWYPYPGNPNTNLYRVARTPALEAETAGSGAFALASTDADLTFLPTAGEPESAFEVRKFEAVRQLQPAVPGERIELAWHLGGLEIEQLGEGVADRLPAGLRLVLPGLTVPPSGGVSRVRRTLEVEDPGLNHQSLRWLEAAESSLWAVNPAAIAARGRERVADGWTRWTPAGRSGEWQEGWIGHLPLDTPWRSVDLFDSEGQWWLRHTRSHGWTPGPWMRNKVNPNADQPEAFSAVFLGLLPFRWPEAPPSTALGAENAAVLAADLAASYLLDEGSDQRGAWSGALQTGLLGAGLERHEAESILQQTLARLSPNYQLYGLLLLAECRGAAGGGRFRINQALILWMDPYPAPSSRFRVMKLSRQYMPVFF